MKAFLTLIAALTFVVKADDDPNRKASEERQKQIEKDAADRAADNAAKQQADEARKRIQQGDEMNRTTTGG
jgi:hypothetical protein